VPIWVLKAADVPGVALVNLELGTPKKIMRKSLLGIVQPIRAYKFSKANPTLPSALPVAGTKLVWRTNSRAGITSKWHACQDRGRFCLSAAFI
jgi:hypothetical protein